MFTGPTFGSHLEADDFSPQPSVLFLQDPV